MNRTLYSLKPNRLVNKIICNLNKQKWNTLKSPKNNQLVYKRRYSSYNTAPPPPNPPNPNKSMIIIAFSLGIYNICIQSNKQIKNE
jgi:hypothetical protein